jgi:hypothetical protein
MLAQADHFADRVAGSAGASAQARIELAFRLAFARPPRPQEQAVSAAFLKKLAHVYDGQKHAAGQAERKALARLCHMLLCANEFLYVG